MKMKRSSFRTVLIRGIGCMVIFLLLIAAAKTVKVSKETPGRKGPGSYYELTALIPAGTKLEVIEKKKSWLKVKFKDQELWISENSLSEAANKAEDPFAAMALGGARAEASPAAIAAAIKGFWTRYSRTNKADLAELPVNGYDISPASYDAFERVRSRAVSRDELLKKYKLSKKYRTPEIPYVKEQQSGYSVASSVAEGRLFEDEKVIAYVHSVGWYIAEGTERPDIRYNYYILDTDQINAISCPGGYVILTRGLLELLDNEAELAALLAHEMAHVIAGHGMKEVYEDKVRIVADDAFAALNKQTSGSSKMEEDLIAITNRAISIAKSPKLDKYEFEADEMALRYMARSGYDLGGLAGLLTKLKSRHDREVDMFDLNYRNHPDFKKRMDLSAKKLKKYKRYTGRKFAENFNENMVF